MDEPKIYTIKEYLLYKLDRTLTIIGIIGLGAIAIFDGKAETNQIATAAMGGLIGYIGGRVGNAK